MLFRSGYCVFVNYSGHVDLISIRVTPSKKQYNEWLFSIDSYSMKQAVKELAPIVETLKDRDGVLAKAKHEKICKEFMEQVKLGVHKARAIKNMAEKFGETQVYIKSIINQPMPL